MTPTAGRGIIRLMAGSLGEGPAHSEEQNASQDYVIILILIYR